MILDLELSTYRGTTFNHHIADIAVYHARGLSDGATMFPAAQVGENTVKPSKNRSESRMILPISTGVMSRSWHLTSIRCRARHVGPMSFAVDVIGAFATPIQPWCPAIDTAVQRLYLTRAVFLYSHTGFRGQSDFDVNGDTSARQRASRIGPKSGLKWRLLPGPSLYEHSNLGTGISLRPGFFPDSYQSTAIFRHFETFLFSLSDDEPLESETTRECEVEVLSLPGQDSDIRCAGKNRLLGYPQASAATSP